MDYNVNRMEGERIHYLYRHIRLDKNEPFYVGIGTVYEKDVNNPNVKYFYKRAYSTVNRGKHWKWVTAKSGYEVEILLESDDYEFIKLKEIEFISLYGRKDLELGTLVNYTNGGDGNTGHKHTEEWKKARSEAMSGENNPFYGKKLSEEHRQNVINSIIGRKHSEETKKKQSEAHKGDKHYLYGKKANPNTIEALKKANTGSISHNAEKVIDIITLCIFDSVKRASVFYEINYHTLHGYMKGKSKNKTNLIYLSEYIKQNPNFKNE